MAKKVDKKKEQQELKKFKIGDQVNWQSSARGYQTVKEGKIVAIIKAGENPTLKMQKLEKNHILRCSSESQVRKIVSYLVSVEIGGEDAKRALYWPRTQHLA